MQLPKPRLSRFLFHASIPLGMIAVMWIGFVRPITPSWVAFVCTIVGALLVWLILRKAFFTSASGRLWVSVLVVNVAIGMAIGSFANIFETGAVTGVILGVVLATALVVATREAPVPEVDMDAEH